MNGVNMSNKFDVSKGKYWQRGLTLVDGCTPCSPGCDHCWSASMAHRFYSGRSAPSLPSLTNDKGTFNGDLLTHYDRLSVPMKRKKPTVYAIWNDLFHEDVQSRFVENVYNTIAQCPQHTFLILTKRPQEVNPEFIDLCSRENIYHGLTICNQQEADEKIPIFLQVPGKKFLSIEPMLGEINFRWMKWISREHSTEHLDILKDISCVILGGETGPGARPMHPDWARSVRDQCEVAGVPFFLKSTGRGKGRLLDGREHNDLPWRQL